MLQNAVPAQMFVCLQNFKTFISVFFFSSLVYISFPLEQYSLSALPFYSETYNTFK